MYIPMYRVIYCIYYPDMYRMQAEYGYQGTGNDETSRRCFLSTYFFQQFSAYYTQAGYGFQGLANYDNIGDRLCSTLFLSTLPRLLTNAYVYLCTYVWFIYMHPSTSYLKYFMHRRSSRARIQLTSTRKARLHSCRGIYTAPLAARALECGVEKHLVVNMQTVTKQQAR